MKVARTGVCVELAPTLEQDLAHVRPAIAGRVLEEKRLRSLLHDDTSIGERQRRRDVQPLGEHGDVVGLPVAVGVLEDLDGGIPARLLDQKLLIDQDVDDVLQGDIRVMRRHRAAPADVHPHALQRQAGGGLVEHLHVPLDDVAEVAEGQMGEDGVPAQREIRAVELQQEARPNDRLVLGLHDGAERAEVGDVVGVVAVAQESRDLAR